MQPRHDAHGAIVGMVGVALDVTARTREIRHLRQGFTSLAHAQRIARLGNWELDLLSGRLFWSDQIYEIFGVDRTRFGANYHAFLSRVHPDDRQRMDDAQRRAIADEAPLDLEHRIVLPDGSERVVHELGELECDVRGTPIRLRGVVHGITERRAAARRIEHLNRVYAVLSATNRAIARERSVEALLDAICRVAVDEGQLRAAWVALTDASGAPRPVAAAGAMDGFMEQGDLWSGTLPTVAATLARGSHLCDDIALEPADSPWHGEAMRIGYRSCAAFRIAMRGQALGAIGFLASEPYFFDATEVGLLEELIADLSFALEVHEQTRERERVEQALRDSEARLRTSMRDLRALSARLQSVREQERARVARDVHDHLGQALTALKLDLAEVTRRLATGDRASVEARLRDMATLIDSAVDDVRRVASELRPVHLDDLDLVDAMRAYVVEIEQRSGIRCVLHAAVTPLAIDEGRAVALFRIMQEALTNVVRHARARRADVRLSVEGETVQLAVQDDGCGLPPADQRRPGALGLLGMRDRARLFGGDVHVSPAQPTGTKVVASLPRSGDEP